jgi:peptide/nickel transport system substrate-binding protein
MNGKATWRLGVLLALVLFAVATLGARAGHSAKQGAGRQAASSTLIDGTTDSVVNIDPAASYDFGSKVVQDLIFQRLLEVGPGSLAPHPALATKCGFVGGLRTYACSLRHGVKFHNGHLFTSADVKFSFDRTVRIKDPSGIYTLLANLKSVATRGKYGVVFHLIDPSATWPQFLTTNAGLIVPKGAYPADKALPNTSKQFGTGPYQLVKYQPGQTAVFKKFKGYWGKPAKTSNVIIRYYSKSSTMKLALQQKAIDMAFPGANFTPTELVSLRKAKGIKVHQGPGASIRYLVLNTAQAPTNKLAVRRAIAYLMPRQTIASRVYHGLVSPLYTMVAKGLPGHTDAFKAKYGATPSLAKARAALKAANISTPVNITIWYTPSHYGDSSADEYAEIQRALQAGGLFKVTLQTAEWATYSKTLGRQYGTFQLGWFPDYVDAENYLVPFYYSPSNFPKNNYKSSKVDALLKQEQGTKSLPKRLKIIKQVQTIVANDAPIIPYWQAPIIAVSRTNVQGIDKTLDPSFIMRLYLVSKS